MDKREHIMQAALELFAERGYHGTPVSLIAERANVGSGTIYRYFRDKDDLVNNLYRHWKQKFFEFVALEEVDASQSIRALFRTICFKIVQFAMQYREAFVFLEAHHHAPYLDEESLKLSNDIKAHFFSFLRLGQAQEVIKPSDPELLFPVVFGIFSETIKNSWNTGQVLDDAQILLVEDMAWQAIRR